MADPGQTPLRIAGTKLLQALPGLAPTFLVVALLACVLVPLPTGLVDLLLSLSLAGSVLLLVASLGIRRTTEFLTFPSLLLLATLFRLALNISTTRLILSQAYAGNVVEAFASFVVRGDLVVGAVMFLIITIVQYVVIARGAERVAEVAARFALDGLPGSQAAIDADLRAGVISPREASLRRARLGERSSFYGAMDGAVRFVKGDAIAGLAIIAVNLIGGLVIGVGRLGLPWEEALQRYGRLTIGDGLLAQIPALLVSLAAGVLVSRVDRQRRTDPGATLSWLDPAMLMVPAVMLLVLALVPRMPQLAFLTTAAALVGLALILALRRASLISTRPTLESEGRQLSVHLGASTVADPRTLERALAEVRLRCASALGVEVPEIELVVEPGYDAGRGEVHLDGRLCRRTDQASCGDEDAIVLLAYRAVMDNAVALVDLQDLDRMLESVRASHPVVVERALATVELPDLLLVVRAFLRERIPLPPLRELLSAIAESPHLADPAERVAMTRIVRETLAQFWVPPILEAVRGLGDPDYVRPTPDAEAELLDAWTPHGSGGVLNLSPNERTQWLQAIGLALQVDADPSASPRAPLVVVSTPAARRAFAELVSGRTPHVHVLSTTELAAAGVAASPRWVAPP